MPHEEMSGKACYFLRPLAVVAGDRYDKNLGTKTSPSAQAGGL
ncbi:hypothetical protein LLB_2862 [Legionella longbeachae D-4968]|nr:hypothetical protein LLB_2862 [Legionella longbeachae D-4968]